MKLRTFLLAVIGLTLVPLLGVAGVAIWWAHQDARRDMEHALLDHARSLGAAVDREIEASLAGLKGLATSSDLDAVDPRTLYEQAGLARAASGRWLTVALADPAGRQVLNLLHPLGSPLPSLAGLETFRRTVQTGEPQVSDLVVEPTAGRWAIVLTLPSHRDGKLRHVLVAVMTPEGFASALAAGHVVGTTVGTIVDRHGLVVATTERQAERVGKPAPTLDRASAYTATSRAPRSSFTAEITIPSEQIDGPFRRSLWLLAGAAGAALALAVILAHLGGRRLARRLRQLTSALRAFARGETLPDVPDFTLAELAGVSGVLREAMALLQTRTAALQESEQRYRTTFERNPAGMCLTQRDGRIVDCNEAFARILGFERPDDVLATNVAALYTNATERAQLLERVETEGIVVNVELQLRRRDSRLIWVLASLIRGSGPPRADYETTLIDITEQKAADELRSIARLANAAAHEINNPLTVIVGRLALLRNDPDVSPESRERLAQAHAAAERIGEIVADMYRLTRVQLFEHTGRGLPEMIDIRKSAGDADGAGAR